MTRESYRPLAGAAASVPAPVDLAPLEEILTEHKDQQGAVIPLLQHVQDVYGFLPREVLGAIAKKTSIPLSTLYGVATFYAQFHLSRRGRHLVRVCDGTACHVRGAARTIDTVKTALGVEVGGTSPDYKYTLEVIYCLGSCGLSPVAVVDDKVCGRLQPEEFVKRLETLS
jgi:NADH-quinone oxidoreductase subunit E